MHALFNGSVEDIIMSAKIEKGISDRFLHCLYIYLYYTRSLTLSPRIRVSSVIIKCKSKMKNDLECVLLNQTLFNRRKTDARQSSRNNKYS